MTTQLPDRPKCVQPAKRAAGAAELSIPADRLPRHIAIIMDGNGRWALQQGKMRIAGHREGAKAVKRTITHCSNLGVEYLTLYSFSLENWKRPQEEVGALMSLAVEQLIGEREHMVKNNVRFKQIGRRDPLPREVLEALDKTVRATSQSSGLTVQLALNYGSRAEIVDATKTIAGRVAAGELAIDDIDESTIDQSLYTAGVPDPDLLIRTAGEYRLSNYLLWQLSYAEIHVTDALWPTFDMEHLRDAIRDYASRDRRFGGVDASNS